MCSCEGEQYGVYLDMKGVKVCRQGHLADQLNVNEHDINAIYPCGGGIHMSLNYLESI